jgi:hypothetical protein
MGQYTVQYDAPVIVAVNVKQRFTLMTFNKILILNFIKILYLRYFKAFIPTYKL